MIESQRVCRFANPALLSTCPVAFFKNRQSTMHPCSLDGGHKGDHVCACGKRRARGPKEGSE